MWVISVLEKLYALGIFNVRLWHIAPWVCAVCSRFHSLGLFVVVEKLSALRSIIVHLWNAGNGFVAFRARLLVPRIHSVLEKLSTVGIHHVFVRHHYSRLFYLSARLHSIRILLVTKEFRTLRLDAVRVWNGTIGSIAFCS
jgi:hypothetical protein